MWGYTTDDFSDDLFSVADHAWLDSLDEAHARVFAAAQGYDLVDEERHADRLVGLLLDDPRRETQASDAGESRGGRAAIEEKYLPAPNVIGVIVGR